MVNTNKINNFNQSLNKLKLSTENVDKERKNFKNEAENFSEKIAKLELDKSIKEKNENIASILEGNLAFIKGICQAWKKDFDAKLKEEKFQDDLKNNFLVIVYGKVKAGKSSLGNFIAENSPDENIEFFKYDEAGKEENIQKLTELNEKTFAVDNLECTSSIQGFRTSSLAWIDTPGLFSMTEENGKLARTYIEAADFIIFPLSSEAPQEMENIKAIKELIEQANKKVTVIITKSDFAEEDECECGSEEGCEKCKEGIIKIYKNKDEQRRKMQEAGVLEELKNVQSMLVGDIFSLSAFTAKEALKNGDEELYEKSNMDKFYSMFIDVIENKASKFKAQAPRENLQAFKDKLLFSEENSLKTIENSLLTLQNDLDEESKKMDKFKEESLYFARTSLENHLSAATLNINKSNSQEELQKLSEKINEEVKKNISENLSKVFSSFEKSFESFQNNLSQNFEIKDKTKEISYSTSSRSAWGAFVETVSFGLINMTDSTSHSRTVVIGDNSYEVIKAFKDEMRTNMEKLVKEAFAKTKNELFENVEELIMLISSYINSLKIAVKKDENA